MWTALATAEQCLDCRRPFSFYFDLVHAFWRAPAPTNTLTLHRLCTLARKQGVAYAMIECAINRADVREEIDALDANYGGGGSAEAVKITFFSGGSSPENINDVDSAALLGTLVLINYRRAGSQDWTRSYVHEAIIAPPFKLNHDGGRIALLNNFILKEAEFQCAVRGRGFTIRGIYFCQQNGETHVCAHACLRMAINTLGHPNGPLTSDAINVHLNLAPPFTGLSLGQIVDVIEWATGARPMIADCTTLSKQNYLSILGSYIESGCIVLLVFTTANAMEHVVTVFGYTRNSDEWHPQAIPGYSGPQTAQFYTSSSWIDHFLIHDDNLGPHYTLSSRALEVDPTISAHWIIAIHPHIANISPHYAESLAAIVLGSSLASLGPYGVGRWFDHITRYQQAYVMRAILISRENYQMHLTESVGHDGSSLTPQEIALADDLPDWFWMVEFSLPALFTGNRSKLGEVIVSADSVQAAQPLQLIQALRVPSLFAVRNGAGQFFPRKASLTAHSPYYEAGQHANEW
jgi:hypothetical protein